jgi:hypothetical protein
MNYDEGRLVDFQKRYAPSGLQLKFVVLNDAQGNPLATDLERAEAILKPLAKAAASKRPPVYFIPEAYGKSDYIERCRRLNSAVEKMGLRLKGWDLRVQPQWHRVLHGDERRR